MPAGTSRWTGRWRRWTTTWRSAPNGGSGWPRSSGEGRLAVGPWQILHDEFLCSGENIVRNLELGMRRAEELGAAMMVGYLPDQFGHCAQTPQILRLAGIEHACLWRGVPDRVRTRAFAWEAPDGTAIRTQYLPEGGYGNAASMFEEFGNGASLLPGRAAGFAESMGRWYPDGGPLLAMYGADHTAPAPDLADRVASAGLGMRLDTLAGYFAGEEPSVDGLPRIRGELRSHARANILPGVLSARVRLKQMMGRAERLVERYAEPLAALWYSGDAQRFLDLAWRRLIEASCHDSVTGCGSDETAEQVAAHMAEAEQLGRAVCDLVTAERAAAVPLGSHLVFNPTPAARTGLVVLDVPCDGEPGLVTGDGRPVPVQTLDVAPTVLDDAVHPASALPILLERVYGRVLFGQEIRDWSVSREDRTLTFHVTARAGGPFDIGDVREALRGADGEWRVRILADPRRTVAALVDVPALGLTTVRPVPRRGSRKGRCGPRRTSSTTAFCAPKCATTATSCCAHRPATSSRASGGSWTAATSATPTTTLRPPPTRSSATREPWPSARSPRDRSSPRSTSSGRTAGPPSATCRATPAPRPRRTSPSPPGPSCARASRSCGSASRSTTAATTIASGCTCPCRARRTRPSPKGSSRSPSGG
ncbi:hypothetical protein [Actinomadura madurae]|uniref:glycoside hydrolase family 38 N-terminal domain-containing protein n=1 Tax=Actinomadura madurae TaxID=1993 RepID=UPI0032B07B63